MSEVRYDAVKNRVYITIDEFLNLEKAVEHKEMVMKIVDQTKLGFTD